MLWNSYASLNTEVSNIKSLLIDKSFPNFPVE